MTPAEVEAIVGAKLDASMGLTLLALMEQMLGIQPSTFDPDNQARVSTIVAHLSRLCLANPAPAEEPRVRTIRGTFVGEVDGD